MHRNKTQTKTTTKTSQHSTTKAQIITPIKHQGTKNETKPHSNKKTTRIYNQSKESNELLTTKQTTTQINKQQRKTMKLIVNQIQTRLQTTKPPETTIKINDRTNCSPQKPTNKKQ